MQPNLSPDVMLAALRMQNDMRAVQAAQAQAAFQQGQLGMPLHGFGAVGSTASGLLAQAIPAAPAPAGLQPHAMVQAQANLGLPMAAAPAASPSQGAEAPASGASRLQTLREEKARKEAATTAEEARLRCHLHSKPKNNCKNCKRYKEFMEKGKEEKAVLKEKFIEKLREKVSDNRSVIEEDTGLISRPLDIANKMTFGFPPLLQSHIIESQHFKTVMDMESFDKVVDELYAYADGVEPYAQQSSFSPSCLFVCIYRLFALGIDGRQLRQLLESTDNPYVRCAGILFVRYGLAPDQFWPWLGEYVLDEEEFPPGKACELGNTIGEYVEFVLTQDFYYKTVLPRVPSTTKSFLDTKLAQVPQYRKRSQANQRILDVFREKGLRVEARPHELDWQEGQAVALIERSASRLKVRVRWDNPRADQKAEQDIFIGKVILSSDSGSAAGSRGSSVVDWSRDKGRSAEELLEDRRNAKREQAVCSSGKDYAKRPVSFQVACPMEQGSACHGLIREETLVTQKSRRGGRDRSRSPLEAKRKEPSLEHQARMKAVFEKYGASKPEDKTRRGNDVDRPDVMRLG